MPSAPTLQPGGSPLHCRNCQSDLRPIGSPGPDSWLISDLFRPLKLVCRSKIAILRHAQKHSFSVISGFFVYVLEWLCRDQKVRNSVFRQTDRHTDRATSWAPVGAKNERFWACLCMAILDLQTSFRGLNRSEFNQESGPGDWIGLRSL